MGYNTSVIIMNDALDQIEKDPLFGKNLSRACLNVIHGDVVDVAAGNHCNAATVIETHHADATSLVAFGGNQGQHLGTWFIGTSNPLEERVLRQLAETLGYRLTKNS